MTTRSLVDRKALGGNNKTDMMEQAVRVRRKCRWCTRYILRNIWPCSHSL